MKNYTKQMVFDYVLGNDIDDELLEKLENDIDFMTDVVCKDKKAYNLCSDEIKTNYDFVIKVIENYKNDVEFVTKVCKKYITSLDTELDKSTLYEIYIRISEITNEEDDNHTFSMLANMFFECDQLGFEKAKLTYHWKMQESFGLGFSCQRELYKNNKVILDYISKKYINEIFCENFDLELQLHESFNSYSDFEKCGKNNVLIEYISYYDGELAEYIAANPILLSNLDKKIRRIKNNWNEYDFYLQRLKIEYESQKYNRIVDRVMDYCREEFNHIDPYDILGYVANQFGVKEEISKCFINEKTYSEIIFDQIDRREISEEEGIEMIDKNLKNMLGQEKSKCDLLVDYFGLSNIKKISDLKHLKAVQEIFAEELGYQIKEIKKTRKRLI